MHSGYLQKRSSPISPPQMQRFFCVLWGTILLDHDSDEDARTSVMPHGAVEIIGVSEWDGVCRFNSFPYSFLVVTHTGCTYYLSAGSLEEKNEWMQHIKCALEFSFGNPNIVGFKPRKDIYAKPVPVVKKGVGVVCAKTNVVMNPYQASILYCSSCARGFSSNEYISESSTLLQCCEESAIKMCSDCKNAQCCVMWVKIMNYIHAMTLHHTSTSSTYISDVVSRYKATFSLQRKQSSRLDMAALLLEQGSITLVEFHELRQVDWNYTWEMVSEERNRIGMTLDMLGNDMQTIISLLLSSASVVAPVNRLSYYQVVSKLMSLADTDVDLLDFYWPQVLQVHFLETRYQTVSSMIKVDMLQQALLSICAKVPVLALKTAWSLIASLSVYDGSAGSTSGGTVPNQCSSQYAACMCLLLQLDMVICGRGSAVVFQQGESSKSVPSADDGAEGCVQRCRQLIRLYKPAAHQQKEIEGEFINLLSLRLKLYNVHEIYSQMGELGLEVQKGGGKGKDREEEPTATASTQEAKVAQVQTAGDMDQEPEEDDDDADSGFGDSCDFAINMGDLSQDGISDAIGTGQDEQHSLQAAFVDRNRSKLFYFDRDNCELQAIHRLVLHQGVLCSGEDGTGNSTFAMFVRMGNMFTMFSKRNNLDKLPPRVKRVSDDDSHGDDDSQEDDDTEEVQSGGKETFDGITGLAAEEATSCLCVERYINGITRWRGFGQQLDFIDILTEMVEGLRFIDRPLRTSRLKSEVGRMNKAMALDAVTGTQVTCGLDPTTSASDSRLRIIHICVDECRVFRTKARAPSLLVCIVQDDGTDGGCDTSSSCAQQLITGDVSKGNNSSPQRQQTHVHTHLPHPRSASEEESSLSAMVAQTVEQQAAELSTVLTVEGGLTPHTLDTMTNRHDHMASMECDAQLKQELDKMKRDDSWNDLTNLTEDGNPIREPFPPVQTHAHSHGAVPTPTSTTSVSSSKSSMLGDRKEGKIQGSEDQTLMEFMANLDTGGSHSTSPTPPGPEGVDSNGTADRSNQSGAAASSSKLSVSLSHAVAGPTPNEMLNSTNADMISPSKRASWVTGSGFAVGASSSPLSSATTSTDIDAAIVTPITMVNSDASNRAIRLLAENRINAQEFEQLMKSDHKFRIETEREKEQKEYEHKLENSFGEPWESKKSRILSAWHKDGQTAEGKDRQNSSNPPRIDLRCFIVKSNDDLRQEVCCLQLMELFKEIFIDMGIPTSQLWLKPYQIVSTGSSTGIVEVLPDTMSIDALKKTPGFTTMSNHFNTLYGSSPSRLREAKVNYTASLAAYSLFSYILQVKDRHNGNVLMDSSGHILHIDFGFLLSIAPGGAFSLESAPFKLTDEMTAVMDGLSSPLFGDFVKAFTAGFLALKAHSENIISTLKVLSMHSQFPCFAGKDEGLILEKLRGRFRTDLNIKDTVQHCLELIIASYGALHTGRFVYTDGWRPSISPAATS